MIREASKKPWEVTIDSDIVSIEVDAPEAKEKEVPRLLSTPRRSLLSKAYSTDRLTKVSEPTVDLPSRPFVF